MAVARTSAFPESTQTRGIHVIIGYEFTQRAAVGRSIFNVHDSDQVREHTLTMGGSGTFDEKAEGEAINYRSMNEGFLQTYTYVDYANGFEITRRMYINDLYDSMEKHGAELGRMAIATEETVLANHFNNGFSSSFTGADGVSLFNVSHVREDGNTYRNKPASGNDADLSVTSLEQGLIDFRDQRDGGGKRLQIEPKVLLTAGEGVFSGWKLTESTHDPESDKNTINPLQRLNLSHATWNYLTDTDAWFLLADKDEHLSLIHI